MVPAMLDTICVWLGRARDETLAGLGVRLEDRPDGTSTWKVASG